jgi:hypothetical protein
LILFGHPPEFNGHLFFLRAGVERTQFGRLDFGVSRQAFGQMLYEKKSESGARPESQPSQNGKLLNS